MPFKLLVKHSALLALLALLSRLLLLTTFLLARTFEFLLVFFTGALVLILKVSFVSHSFLFVVLSPSLVFEFSIAFFSCSEDFGSDKKVNLRWLVEGGVEDELMEDEEEEDDGLVLALIEVVLLFSDLGGEVRVSREARYLLFFLLAGV